MSLKTNFSLPCLQAGPTIQYESFHTVDPRFAERTPRYSDSLLGPGDRKPLHFL